MLLMNVIEVKIPVLYMYEIICKWKKINQIIFFNCMFINGFNLIFDFRNSSFATVKFKLHLTANFEGHNSTVWRISWNSVGSILVSSGDDRCVRLWKQCLYISLICLNALYCINGLNKIYQRCYVTVLMSLYLW